MNWIFKNRQWRRLYMLLGHRDEIGLATDVPISDLIVVYVVSLYWEASLEPESMDNQNGQLKTEHTQ